MCGSDLGEFVAQALQRVGIILRSQSASRWIGLATIIVVAAVLLFRNPWIFNKVVFEDGDFAANSILVDKSIAREWLVGHYSRFGFYHPGPFLLYVLALGELLFFRVFHVAASPYGGQFIGLILMSATFVGMCTGVVASRLKTPLASLWLPGLLLLISAMKPTALVSTWPPYMLILPFALLLIATASTVSGSPQHLPIAVLALCVLVHGHASFIAIGGVAAVLTATFLTVQVRRKKLAIERRTLLISAVIVVGFALPILLNTVLNWPGEIPNYISGPQESVFKTRTPWSVVTYIGQFWLATSPTRSLAVGFVILVAIGSALVTKRPLRNFLFALLVVCGLATLLTFGYAYKGIDNLSYNYLTAYYYAVPVVVLLVIVLGLTSLLDVRKWLSIPIAVFGGLFSLWVLTTQAALVSDYFGVGQIQLAEAVISEHIPADKQVVLDFDTDSWRIAIGLVEQYRREGRAVCVDARPAFRMSLTNSEYCTPEEIADGVQVRMTYVPKGQRPEGGTSIEGGWYLTFPR